MRERGEGTGTLMSEVSEPDQMGPRHVYDDRHLDKRRQEIAPQCASWCEYHLKV